MILRDFQNTFVMVPKFSAARANLEIFSHIFRIIDFRKFIKFNDCGWRHLSIMVEFSAVDFQFLILKKIFNIEFCKSLFLEIRKKIGNQLQKLNFCFRPIRSFRLAVPTVQWLPKFQRNFQKLEVKSKLHSFWIFFFQELPSKFFGKFDEKNCYFEKCIKDWKIYLSSLNVIF